MLLPFCLFHSCWKTNSSCENQQCLILFKAKFPPIFFDISRPRKKCQKKSWQKGSLSFLFLFMLPFWHCLSACRSFLEKRKKMSKIDLLMSLLSKIFTFLFGGALLGGASHTEKKRHGNLKLFTKIGT